MKFTLICLALKKQGASSKYLADMHNVYPDEIALGPSSGTAYEQAFLASPYASVVLNWSGQVLACNRRAAQAWWQFPPNATDAIVGTQFAKVTNLPEDEALDRIRTALAAGTVAIPMLNARAPMNKDGVPLRVCLLESEELGEYRLLVSQDVLRPTINAISSIQKQKSIAVRQVRELGDKSVHLEQSLEAARIFTNAASHDLRGPLGSLTGLLKLFSRKFGDDLPEHGQTYLEKIQASADRLQELTLCLLDYASASAGKIEVSKVEVGSVLQSVREELKPQLEACGGTFDIKAGPIEIEAQPVLIRTLFSNICSNALKYRNPGRPLQVMGSARFAASGCIEILVSDNGIGIAEADAERIFKPFERVNSSEPGSGIGLATCAEICKRHGWHISAEGQLGKGTMIRVEIPLAPQLIGS